MFKYWTASGSLLIGSGKSQIDKDSRWFYDLMVLKMNCSSVKPGGRGSIFDFYFDDVDKSRRLFIKYKQNINHARMTNGHVYF